jgi:hypothetical protein
MMADTRIIAIVVTLPARAARAMVAARPARSPPSSFVDSHPADHVRRHPHVSIDTGAVGIIARVRAQARQRAAREKRRTSRRAILNP